MLLKYSFPFNVGKAKYTLRRKNMHENNIP